MRRQWLLNHLMSRHARSGLRSDYELPEPSWHKNRERTTKFSGGPGQLPDRQPIYVVGEGCWIGRWLRVLVRESIHTGHDIHHQ